MSVTMSDVGVTHKDIETTIEEYLSGSPCVGVMPEDRNAGCFWWAVNRQFRFGRYGRYGIAATTNRNCDLYHFKLFGVKVTLLYPTRRNGSKK